MHQLKSLSEKFHYLSSVCPIPPESYDQIKTPDIFIIKSISSHFSGHFDLIAKMNSAWTAHVLAYIFFITFCFIESSQYFSCERDISIKIDTIDIQDRCYRTDGVLEFFERPKQIPLFFLV